VVGGRNGLPVAAAMKPGNDGLRFLLELVVLLSLGYWGYQVTNSPLRWVLLVVAPLVAAVVWSIWVAPKSSSALRDPWRLLLELVVFGAAVAALAWADRPAWAAVIAALVVLHLGLTFVLGQRGPGAREDEDRASDPPPVDSPHGSRVA
jgi:Protein of unknown function (DUF2568)